MIFKSKRDKPIYEQEVVILSKLCNAVGILAQNGDHPEARKKANRLANEAMDILDTLRSPWRNL